MKLQDFTKTLGQLKNEVETLIAKNSRLNQAQQTVQDFVKHTESELKNMVEKDLPKLLKKFNQEKDQLEKSVEKVVKEEIKKAQNFVSGHKKELTTLQRKIEKALKDKGINLPGTPKAASTASKTAKKKKVGTKKAATKKVASKKAATQKKTAKKSTRKVAAPRPKKERPLTKVKTKVSPNLH